MFTTIFVYVETMYEANKLTSLNSSRIRPFFLMIKTCATVHTGNNAPKLENYISSLGAPILVLSVHKKSLEGHQ